MIKSLFVSSTSVCCEWENDLPYYTEKEYTIYLNGAEALKSNTNVFSLFELTPDTEYEITSSLDDYTLKFRTAKDTCVVNVKDFGAVGDGITDDSLACQAAVNCLPMGARLYFPAGTYLTAPIC